MLLVQVLVLRLFLSVLETDLRVRLAVHVRTAELLTKDGKPDKKLAMRRDDLLKSSQLWRVLDVRALRAIDRFAGG
jgi:hypothetical protein